MTARFSANTGFLWTDLDLPGRIRAAHAAGFDAVEFHDEAQRGDLAAVAAALAETGLPVCGLNVRMGQSAGCAAIPGQEDQARRDVDAAARTAEALGAQALHVLAGRSGEDGDRAAFLRVLRHALAVSDRVVLIEPICQQAMPGYFLHYIDQAAAIIEDIGDRRLRLMFDCFHIQTATGDCTAAFARHAGRVGHVQIASVPGRNEPGVDDMLDYARLIPAMQAAGYGGAFGCEYRPRGTVEAGLGWRARLLAEIQPSA